MTEPMVSTFEFAGHVVGILITTDVDKKLLKEIHRVIDEKCKEHKYINLFVEVNRGMKIPLHLIFKDLIFKLDNASCFSKIAVVSDPGFFRNVMKIKDLLMNADVEAFNPEDRIKAMNWISE